MTDQAKIHRMVLSRRTENRREAVGLLRDAFSKLPDKSQALHDLVRLTQDQNDYVRRRAADALGSVFPHVPAKDEAWHDLHRLTQDQNDYVRWRATEALCLVFPHVRAKDEAWHDLVRLAQDQNGYVRWRATEALFLVFPHVPAKVEAWHTSLPGVRHLYRAFAPVPAKDEAWHDLHRLTQDQNSDVRRLAAEALGSAFPHVPAKDEAWHDLHRLTQDKYPWVQMYAYHSLGKASVYNAAESEDFNALRRYLEEAVGYFEKSAQKSKDGPARFCLPFYRSYFAITFQGESQDAVQKYLAEAKEAVGGSESRDELLKTVENLAEALHEAQRTKDMQLAGMQCDLKAYMRYCDQATKYLNRVEKDAPGAAKLIRKGLPNIDLQIKKTIGSIQEKALNICIQGKETGTDLEATGLELNRLAKGLSENVLKSERICSRIEYTLGKFCNRIPEDKRSRICGVVTEIGLEEQLPNKLIKIDLALSYILNELPIDYDVRKKLDEIHGDIKSLRQSILDQFEISEQKVLSSVFERLEMNKLETIGGLLDAVKVDKISKELIEETLKATRERISEMKSMQIQDSEIAKGLDSWEEIINSPELEVENKIKITIPIIPLLLSYEGSYSFKTGAKLDDAWKKLLILIRR